MANEAPRTIEFAGLKAQYARLKPEIDTRIQVVLDHGRDIIEALAAGKPVLTVGSWDTFVTTGETGILQSSFDAAALARDILRLAGDRELCARLGRAGQERVGRLCNGPDRARDLAEVWRRTSRQV